MADNLTEHLAKSEGVLLAASSRPAPPQRPTVVAKSSSMAEIADLSAGNPIVSRWAGAGSMLWGADQTYDRLPAGFYGLGYADGIGPILKRLGVATDQLVSLPDVAIKSLLAEFSVFWARKAEFEKRGFIHKRGFLLWGPPGAGKTSAVAQMTRRLIADHDGIVLQIGNPECAQDGLRMIRRIEPERPIVCVMEDIDSLIHRYDEAEYLALLDGEAQVDNVCFLATTNYPERLDRRIIDRPSRFDTIMFVGMPSAEARDIYLRHRAPDLTDRERAEWVRLSDGFSVAHLKEMIVAVKCIGQALGEVVERLGKMRDRVARSDAR